jgi:D-alanyl-D-alanine carboxypeptidase
VYQNKRSNPYRIQKQKSPKWPFIGLAVFAAIVLIGGGLLVVKNLKQDKPETAQNADPVDSFNKQQFSLSDPTSPWVVVNKKRPLDPKNYEPSGLRTPDMNVESSEQQVNEQTAAALETLSSAAAAEGISFKLASAYRSYDTQTTIYDSEVRGFGQAQADRESARPGHSEHQTGWAADLGAANGKCELKSCFADTPEGQWLAANAYKFGFIIRYAEGKEHVTGYMHEPWHVRFVGVDLSTEMHEKEIRTLEEFFGLPPAASYN